MRIHLASRYTGLDFSYYSPHIYLLLDPTYSWVLLDYALHHIIAIYATGIKFLLKNESKSIEKKVHFYYNIVITKIPNKKN